MAVVAIHNSFAQRFAYEAVQVTDESELDGAVKALESVEVGLRNRAVKTVNGLNPSEVLALRMEALQPADPV